MAISTVLLLHSLRFFTLEDWHVTNPTTYRSVEIWDNFLECWMMLCIFILSGASAFLEMQKNKPPRTFIRGKALHLLAPLVVGILTHPILQVYPKRFPHGEFSSSLLQWS